MIFSILQEFADNVHQLLHEGRDRAGCGEVLAYHDPDGAMHDRLVQADDRGMFVLSASQAVLANLGFGAATKLCRRRTKM